MINCNKIRGFTDPSPIFQGFCGPYWTILLAPMAIINKFKHNCWQWHYSRKGTLLTFSWETFKYTQITSIIIINYCEQRAFIYVAGFYRSKLPSFTDSEHITLGWY